MELVPQRVRQRVARIRSGHFATSNGAALGLVPVCFVLLGNAVYHAIDAKPKAVAARSLARVRNVEANPHAVLLVDRYAEDWERLWYVLFRGRARILESGDEHHQAILALRRKYVQYRTSFPLDADALVIALDIDAITEWQARSAPVRRRHQPA